MKKRRKKERWKKKEERAMEGEGRNGGNKKD